MPSELQRAAQALTAALDEAPRVADYLQRAAQRCRENAAHIGHLSNNPAARTAALQLDDAARRCDEAARYLAQAASKARDWSEQMVSGGRAPENRSQDLPIRGSPAAFRPVAQDILERLPVRGRRDKTRGVWVDADGNERDLISGIDDYTADAERFMDEHDIQIAPGDITLGSHVEVKFAMFMRERGLTDEIITINNWPCPGPYGCDQNLFRFLPDGARLTVFGPDGFQETYPRSEEGIGT